MNCLAIGTDRWAVFVKDRWYSTDPVEINLNNFKVFDGMHTNSFILADEQVTEYFPHFAYLVPKPCSHASPNEDEGAEDSYGDYYDDGWGSDESNSESDL